MTGSRRLRCLALTLALAATPLPGTAGEPAAPDGGRRELWLVRHGAYDEADPRDEAVGRGLLPIGVAQARLLGERLRALPFAFDAVLASPLTRARETAAVLASDLRLPVTPLADLAECTPPTRRRDVMEGEKPEDLAACTAQLERLAALLLRPAPAGGRRELVVCHGNVIRWLVTRALEVDPASWLVLSVGHASLTRIVVEEEGRVRVVAVGDTGHLPFNLQTGAAGGRALSVRPPARELRTARRTRCRRCAARSSCR